MRELFEKLEAKGISPDAFYMLWSIREKIKPEVIPMFLGIRNLKKLGYVNAEGVITDSGNALLDYIAGAKDDSVPVDEVSNIDKYITIFPKGKLPSGKPARVNKKNIEDAFKWFRKNYDYEWDVILQATLYYIETYEKTNFMYMRNSQYFIRKQNTDKSWDSELANYCESIINGDEEDNTPHFSEKVV